MKPKTNLSLTIRNRVIDCFGRAVEVLEDEDAAKKWLKTENRSIGGVTPLSIINTKAGYQLVLDTLSRIEHGVVA